MGWFLRRNWPTYLRNEKYLSISYNVSRTLVCVHINAHHNNRWWELKMMLSCLVTLLWLVQWICHVSVVQMLSIHLPCCGWNSAFELQMSKKVKQSSTNAKCFGDAPRMQSCTRHFKVLTTPMILKTVLLVWRFNLSLICSFVCAPSCDTPQCTPWSAGCMVSLSKIVNFVAWSCMGLSQKSFENDNANCHAGWMWEGTVRLCCHAWSTLMVRKCLSSNPHCGSHHHDGDVHEKSLTKILIGGDILTTFNIFPCSLTHCSEACCFAIFQVVPLAAMAIGGGNHAYSKPHLFHSACVHACGHVHRSMLWQEGQPHPVLETQLSSETLKVCLPLTGTCKLKNCSWNHVTTCLWFNTGVYSLLHKKSNKWILLSGCEQMPGDADSFQYPTLLRNPNSMCIKLVRISCHFKI